jgi:Spy/CpxP family protein refolding chaperone
MKRTLTVILAVLVVIALSMLSTFAYEHWLSPRHRRAPHPAGHPFALLRGELALTSEQMTRLEAQQEAFENELRGQRAQMREKRMALMEALRADAPDTLAIDRLVEEIGALQTGLEKRMIRHMLQEQTILTPEQRQKLHSIFRKHFNEMGDGPWAGPGGGPMGEMGPGRGRDGGPGRGPHMGPGQFPPPDSAHGMRPGMMGPGPR